MLDLVAIRLIRGIAWALLLLGVGLTALLWLPLLTAGRSPIGLLPIPLALTGCGVGTGATFLWALLLLQAMNAENLLRIREAAERQSPPP